MNMMPDNLLRNPAKRSTTNTDTATKIVSRSERGNSRILYDYPKCFHVDASFYAWFFLTRHVLRASRKSAAPYLK